MSNEEITKLYSDFVYDKDLINGTDPFTSYGYTKEDAYEMIKDNLGIDIQNIKVKLYWINRTENFSSNIISFITLEKEIIFTILFKS